MPRRPFMGHMCGSLPCLCFMLCSHSWRDIMGSCVIKEAEQIPLWYPHYETPHNRLLGLSLFLLSLPHFSPSYHPTPPPYTHTHTHSTHLVIGSLITKAPSLVVYLGRAMEDVTLINHLPVSTNCNFAMCGTASFSDWTAYGGWKKPWAKQYWDAEPACKEVGADVSWRP